VDHDKPLFVCIEPDNASNVLAARLSTLKLYPRDSRNASVSLADLPDRWIGYDAARAVIARADVFQSAPTARLEALLEWVGGGGHLVLIPPATQSGKLHPEWVKRLGIQFAMKVPFEEHAAFSARYGTPSAQTLRSVLEGDPGEALLGDAQGPILARKSCGLGLVSCVALDLAGPSWPLN